MLKFKLCRAKTKQFIWVKELLCSRRHQKLIEETPSPVLTPEQRKDLLEKTVKMVEQIGYEEQCNWLYTKKEVLFLEMNTRVQVEHPVTEVQTGIDIVKEQLWMTFTGDTV